MAEAGGANPVHGRRQRSLRAPRQRILASHAPLSASCLGTRIANPRCPAAPGGRPGTASCLLRAPAVNVFLPPASALQKLPYVSKVSIKGVKYVQCGASWFLRVSPAPSRDASPAPPASWRQNGGGGYSTSGLCGRRQRSAAVSSTSSAAPLNTFLPALDTLCYSAGGKALSRTPTVP